MTEVPPQLLSRWRTGRYVGGAKPNQLVQVRRAFMSRGFQPMIKLDGSTEDFGEISGSAHNDDPWAANIVWIDPGWTDLPNVRQVELDNEFDENGVAPPEVATLTIDNIVARDVMGAAGLYHSIERGYLAPWRGWTNLGRTPTGQSQNEWFEKLYGQGTIVKIWQGYGDAIVPVFIGMIDDADIISENDEMVITCRNFGIMLTDQRLFGWNKAKDIPGVVVFADRFKSDNVEKKSSAPKASSYQRGYPPRNIIDSHSDSFWLSDGHAGPNFTEWCQVAIPKGRYETAYLHPHFAGMETYISIYVRNTGLKGKPAKVNGVPVPNGWLDLGKGDVPGANGGHPFARKWNSISRNRQSKHFLFKLECGDNTVIRFSFRNLGFSPKYKDYRAGVQRMYGARRTLKPDAKKKRWILVDDAADVVKWILMWAGFKEWDVPPFNIKLKESMAFHQGDYLIDVIRHMASQGNFSFKILPPTNHPDSIGVPVFEKLKTMDPPQANIQEVRDTDLLTGMRTKFSTEGLPYIIRVRGIEAKKSLGGNRLGEDTTRRLGATYYPPWSGAHHSVADGHFDHIERGLISRLAGVYKHLHHTDTGVETKNEAMLMCILIAVQASLTAFTGQVEVPGNPIFELNDQISVVDSGTGANTRLFIGNKHSTFTRGEESEWRQTLSGTLLDTPDLLQLTFDYLTLLAKVVEESEDGG